jgi:hypothetical protein
MIIPRRGFLAVLAVLAATWQGQAADWSKEVPVRDGSQPILRFRARVAGDYLVVQAIHEPGWHTYAMDNELRAEEKLAGRPSLGIEEGVEIEIESGGKPVGPWFQSPPRDLSQPDLRWYTWGFDGTATFARRLERTGTGPVALTIGGQTCNGQTCRLIDVELTVPPPTDGENPEFSTDDLVRVRTDDAPDS